MPSIDQSQSLERQLHRRAEQLRSQIETVRARSADAVPGDLRDAKEAADANAQAAVADAEVELDLVELRDINLALHRIAGGTYGVCDDCDQAIDPRRVLAQPAALRCLQCQAVAEAREAATASGRVDHRA
jgi:DnaK suppressor protein